MSNHLRTLFMFSLALDISDSLLFVCLFVCYVAHIYEGHPGTLRSVFTDQTPGGTGKVHVPFTINLLIYL